MWQTSYLEAFKAVARRGTQLILHAMAKQFVRCSNCQRFRLLKQGENELLLIAVSYFISGSSCLMCEVQIAICGLKFNILSRMIRALEFRTLWLSL